MKNLTHRNSFHVFLNDEEAEILDKKFRLSGKSSKSAFIRQLIIRGFVFDIDFSEIQRYNFLLSNIAKNVKPGDTQLQRDPERLPVRYRRTKEGDKQDMAVTKIHAINATVGRAIDYICNPHKTDYNVLVTTFACGRETAEYDFKFALEKTKSRDRNIAYHIIQSFAPGEISGEEAHQIGKEIADRFLQGKYSYVFATHIDRDHIHNHILFAATDNIDHHKFRSTFMNYYRIRNISDELCAEHNKSVIKDFRETGKTYNEWYHSKKGDS